MGYWSVPPVFEWQFSDICQNLKNTYTWSSSSPSKNQASVYFHRGKEKRKLNPCICTQRIGNSLNVCYQGNNEINYHASTEGSIIKFFLKMRGQPCGRVVKFTRSVLAAQSFTSSDPGRGPTHHSSSRAAAASHIAEIEGLTARIYNIPGGFGEKKKKNK